MRLLIVLTLWLLATTGETVARPNILLIFSDDQGMNDVGCYGSEIPTPNIDSIAREGVKFDSFYVSSPICTPSRFGMMTGRYPNRSQDQVLGALMYTQERDDHRGIRPHEKTIAQVLQANGYHTALIGKWHLGHGESQFLPNEHGFDYSYGTTGGCINYFTLKYGYKPDWHRNGAQIEEEGYSTDLLTADAVRYLKEYKKDRPFFLYLAYTAPHYGKGWEPEEKKLTNILQAKDADRAKLGHIADKDRREFAGMVTAMDEGIGRVLETLKKQGLEKDTLVIFTCDNGADPRYGGSNKPFRGQKAQLFEGGIRVPCVMKWAGKIKPGKVIREPATGLDFFPTFCELASIPARDFPLDGASILPLLLKNKAPRERDLFWQLPNQAALRRGDWKYVRNGKEEMLFNLKGDAVESTNLARQEPKRFADLKAAHAAVAGTFGR